MSGKAGLEMRMQNGGGKMRTVRLAMAIGLILCGSSAAFAQATLDFGAMNGKTWIWVDLPDGDRVMFMDEKDGVALPEHVVCTLATNVLQHPAKAS